MIAKLETISPISVLVTPNVLANIGIAGIIRPKPIATKNEIEVSTDTSRGSPVNGERNLKLASLQLHLDGPLHVLGCLGAVSLLGITRR